MPVEFLAGDLLADGTVRAYAHGVNCAGAMGRGIALQFRQRWPLMHATYRQLCRSGEFQPGDLFTWEERGTVVYNLATQQTWREGAILGAVSAALERMLADAEARGLDHVALPRLGAGLGGLPWEDVRAVLARLGARAAVRLRGVRGRRHPAAARLARSSVLLRCAAATSTRARRRTGARGSGWGLACPRPAGVPGGRAVEVPRRRAGRRCGGWGVLVTTEVVAV